MTIFLIYFFVGGLITAVYLTDKNLTTNRFEVACWILTGLLWLFVIVVMAGFTLYENIEERLAVKRLERHSQLQKFCYKLFKLELISKETLHVLQKRK